MNAAHIENIHLCPAVTLVLCYNHDMQHVPYIVHFPCQLLLAAICVLLNFICKGRKTIFFQVLRWNVQVCSQGRGDMLPSSLTLRVDVSPGTSCSIYCLHRRQLEVCSRQLRFYNPMYLPDNEDHDRYIDFE